MNEKVMTTSTSYERPGGRIDHVFRQVLARRLDGLDGGQLRVHDGWGEWHVGRSGRLSARIEVRDPRFYRRIALGGSLGAAESYADGDWDSPDLTGLFRLFVRNIDLLDQVEGGVSRLSGLLARLRHRFNANSRGGSRRNIGAHYDLGNDFFSLFLDDSLTYSSGIYEPGVTTLADASSAKLERICRKLGLRPEHNVLEIGSGWGSFAIHAAARFGCRVTTTTISREQHDLARERVAAAGLSGRVDVLLTDYRDLSGCFDRLVSIEMIEAVGHEFLPTYFSQCARLLADDGLMCLQGINMPDRRYRQYLASADFIRTHIFPGSCCPSLGAILAACAGSSDLRTLHVEDFGPHYARTLKQWHRRFESHYDDVLALGYSERFARLWRFYLNYCEAGFEERYIGVSQMLLAKPGYRGDPVLGVL